MGDGAEVARIVLSIPSSLLAAILCLILAHTYICRSRSEPLRRNSRLLRGIIWVLFAFIWSLIVILPMNNNWQRIMLRVTVLVLFFSEIAYNRIWLQIHYTRGHDK